MPDKRRVDYWHNKAEEARVIAQAMTHEETRLTMLGIAADFDRMARLALDNLSLTQKVIDQETTNLCNRSEIADALLHT